MKFIDDSRVRIAVLLEPSGRVLAQHGFTRSIDVMSACALASAIQASAAEIGRQLDGTPFTTLHHPGHHPPGPTPMIDDLHVAQPVPALAGHGAHTQA